MKKSSILALLLAAALFTVLCIGGCGSDTSDTPAVSESSVSENDAQVFSLDSLPSFEVTSESLSDEWDDEISNTPKGSNLSPQLSWEEVDGATEYAVFFIDESAANWLHMKKTGVTGTSLALGAVGRPSSSDGARADGYVGPYPPEGTHDYVIYILALRESLEDCPGMVDYKGDDAETLASRINESSDGGNILACGKLSGKYTRK